MNVRLGFSSGFFFFLEEYVLSSFSAENERSWDSPQYIGLYWVSLQYIGLYFITSVE